MTTIDKITFIDAATDEFLKYFMDEAAKSCGRFSLDWSESLESLVEHDKLEKKDFVIHLVES